MAQIPNHFQTQQQVLVNYDFADILSNVGYITYYGYKDEDSYKLTRNTIYSNRVWTISATTSGTSDQITHDVDFDILLSTPQTIKGELIASVPTLAYVAAGSPAYSIYQIIRVRKWDGSTETNIASDTGETISAGTNEGKIQTTSVTIPKTSFAAGETLRITVENHMWVDAGSGNSFILGHDPQNRALDPYSAAGPDFGDKPTIMTFHVPFDLGGKI